MEVIDLHPPDPQRTAPINPLPGILQTPSGFAILEMQGTIHLPEYDLANISHKGSQVGKVVFPLYSSHTPEDQSWMKRVYLYVGKHQRMTGEVKKLGKPLAMIRKRQHHLSSPNAEAEDLEIVEVIRYKIIFSQRPEPVGEDSAP